MRIGIGIVLLLAVGCGGGGTDEIAAQEPPTCSEAWTAAYAEPGCYWYDLTYDPPEPVPFGEALYICREIVSIVGTDCRQCQPELDDWLWCTPTMCEAGGGGCNAEFDRLLACCP